jgi:hypothetical protein
MARWSIGVHAPDQIRAHFGDPDREYRIHSGAIKRRGATVDWKQHRIPEADGHAAAPRLDDISALARDVDQGPRTKCSGGSIEQGSAVIRRRHSPKQRR